MEKFNAQHDFTCTFCAEHCQRPADAHFEKFSEKFETFVKIRMTIDEAVAQFKPGLYKHYKGGMYKAVMLVQHHETREWMVLYKSVFHDTWNVRELCSAGKDSWCDRLELPQIPASEVPNDYHGSTEFVHRFTFVYDI